MFIVLMKVQDKLILIDLLVLFLSDVRDLTICRGLSERLTDKAETDGGVWKTHMLRAVGRVDIE